MKISIVVPCYNEINTIGTIINRINNLLADGVQPIKYKIQKSSILSIYGNEDFKQKLKL